MSFLTCLTFYIVVGLYSGAVVKFSCHPAKKFMVPTPAWSFRVGFVCSPCACVSSLWVLKHWEEGRSSKVHRAEVKLSVKQQWKASTAATLCDLFPFIMNSLVALFPPEAHFFGSSSSSQHMVSFMIGPSSSQSTENLISWLICPSAIHKNHYSSENTGQTLVKL